MTCFYGEVLTTSPKSPDLSINWKSCLKVGIVASWNYTKKVDKYVKIKYKKDGSIVATQLIW